MKKMMTISLDPDVIDLLRTLSGSPRKVGEFLGGAIRFLAIHADEIKAHDWSELHIVSQMEFTEQQNAYFDAAFRELRAATIKQEAATIKLEERIKAIETK